MGTHRWLGVAILLAGASAAQNFISDGGFENGLFPVACTTQGVVVTTWFQAGATVPGADTWSFNCAQAAGLNTNMFGHFTPLGGAHGGVRITAGYGGANEAFGTALNAPLTPGASYVLGGWFTASYTLGGAGGYDVWLSTTQSVGGTYLGAIGANAITSTWRCDALPFVAPALPGGYIILDPVVGYVGTDDWYLIPATTPLYQINQAGIVSGNINGTLGTAWCSPVTTVSLANGPAVTVNLSAAAFDVAFDLGPPIPSLIQPAIVLPDGEVFNLNLGTVLWLCPGGPAPCLAGNLSLPFTPPIAGLTVTAQVVAFGVGPLGVSLSQPFTLRVVP